MPIQFQLREEHIDALGSVRDLGVEKLNKIISVIKALDPSPIHPSGLFTIINDTLNEEEKNAQQLVNVLITLYTFMRQRGLSPEQTLEGIFYGISTGENKWTDEQIVKLKEVEPQVKELLSISAIWTAMKAADLSYDYTYLLQNIKILTDVRPVFSQDADAINGAVISYTLRLYIDSLKGSESISVAMDLDDIRHLHDVCERALAKTNTTKKFLSETGIKAYICGEEE